MANTQQFSLGIDLGGTKIEVIALDQKGNEHFRERIDTPKNSTASIQYQEILNAIAHLVSQCENHLKQYQLPLGIGIPGSESLDTGLIKNANTTCLIGKPFRDDLSHVLQRAVKIENDANCFALSEAMDGAGKHAQSVFAVILGTGVGGGWVINKHLMVGPNHICGEWGHNPLPWPTEQDAQQQTCYCGKLGCIETYLSGPGWAKQTELEQNIKLNSKEIVEQRHNVTAAQQSYRLYVERLAKSLASVINIMDPDVIVLGGGLSNIVSLYEDIPKVWGKYVFSDGVKTQLVQNQYGDSSGVRGAAWLN